MTVLGQKITTTNPLIKCLFLFLALQFAIIDKLQSKFIDTDLGP